MIIDVTGTNLIPGDCGEKCPGRIVCCDECDYLSCCLEDFEKMECPHREI